MKIDSILAIAQKEVGTKEYPPGSNNVKYNTWFYGHEVSGPKYPWCAVFQSWVFKGTNLIKKSASCSDIYHWFKARGQIVTKPKKGDLVFFKFGKDYKDTDHIGLVKNASQWPANFQTIEGNTSVTSDDNGGCVMERTRSKSKVVAFVRPAYDDVDVEEHVTTTIGVTNKPTLKMGSKGDWVKVAQARLVVNGYNIEVDGDFGPKTKEAVIKFQTSYGLEKDGIIGPKTWAKLYP